MSQQAVASTGLTPAGSVAPSAAQAAPPRLSSVSHPTNASKPTSSSQEAASEDSFEARPSNRLGKNHKIKADGDTWQELMAVCEVPGTSDGQLMIRSYYQNSRTNERVWDEPPSGATNILPASEEVRRMATLQLEEMHVIDANKAKKKKKGVLGKLFGSGKKKKETDVKRKIQYKAGSKMYAKQATRDTEEAMVQEAIAASIAESRGETYVSSIQTAPPTNVDEELEMAKALSMSAAEHEEQQHVAAAMNGVETEEEMLARIMEQSKLETKRGEGALLAFDGNPNLASNIASNSYDTPIWVEEDDRKMPPMMKPPPGTTTNNAAPPVTTPPAASHYNVTSTTPYAATGTSAAAMAPPSPYTPHDARKAASSTSPVAAMFDPYRKDAPPPAPTPTQMKQTPPTQEGDLKKMDDNANGNSKMRIFHTKASSRKIQDQAGLV